MKELDSWDNAEEITKRKKHLLNSFAPQRAQSINSNLTPLKKKNVYRARRKLIKAQMEVFLIPRQNHVPASYAASNDPSF